MKRKQRYLLMFSELGHSIRQSSINAEVNLNGFFQGDSRRIRFVDEIDWAMQHLKKDDRIIWYLSVIQRFACICLRDRPISKTRKLRRRIDKRLKGFTDRRIMEDIQNFDKSIWLHFLDLQAVTCSQKMKDYSFFNTVDNRAIPKPSKMIKEDFQKLETNIHDRAEDRFCSDGKKFIEFDNGWAWFRVMEGFSKQEAIAMRHCGNGEGKAGDVLYSLREPIKRINQLLWKPHLTFIVNDGYLGESKGFANQKPASRYHPYIARLLVEPPILGIKGGGYLPKSNFRFLDFEPSLQMEVLETRPTFEFDPVNQSGDLFVSSPCGNDWQLIDNGRFPTQASNSVNLLLKARSWIVLKKTIFTSQSAHDQSLAWCNFSEGQISDIHYECGEISSDAIFSLLKDPRIKNINEDLLSPKSQTGAWLNEVQLKALILQKPTFFLKSPLVTIFNRVGHSEEFVSIINQRFNLKASYCEDGLQIECYESLEDFAAQTAIGSMPRKIAPLEQALKENPKKLEVLEGYNFFPIPWLRLRAGKGANRGFPVLYIKTNSILHFFETISPEGKPMEESVLREAIYKFGPPQIPLCI